VSSTSTYVNLEDLIEPVIAQFKSEIKNVSGIDIINEGEEPYDGQYDTGVWVVPGQMRGELSNTASLRWRMTLYVIMVNSQEGATLSELRGKAYEVYNELAKDPKHNDTCWVSIPRLFHPGYMQFTDERLFVGVLMSYEVTFYQRFINDSS